MLVFLKKSGIVLVCVMFAHQLTAQSKGFLGKPNIVSLGLESGATFDNGVSYGWTKRITNELGQTQYFREVRANLVASVKIERFLTKRFSVNVNAAHFNYRIFTYSIGLIDAGNSNLVDWYGNPYNPSGSYYSFKDYQPENASRKISNSSISGGFNWFLSKKYVPFGVYFLMEFGKSYCSYNEADEVTYLVYTSSHNYNDVPDALIDVEVKPFNFHFMRFGLMNRSVKNNGWVIDYGITSGFGFFGKFENKNYLSPEDYLSWIHTSESYRRNYSAIQSLVLSFKVGKFF